MGDRYKIILSNNKNLYKEIELAPDVLQVKVGTGLDCDVRLYKEMFFGQIELLFVRNKSKWMVQCSDNLYLAVGDVRKLMTKNLVHGDILEVKYQDTDTIAFSFDFLIDFDNGKNYDRIIDVAGKNTVSIGFDEINDIIVKSPYVQNDAIMLERKDDGFVLRIKQTSYGVYVNGKKAKDGDGIKNMDFLSMSDYFFYYKENKLWTEIRSDMRIKGLGYEDKPTPNSYPKFRRSTRIRTVINDEKIEILDPPAKPQKPKNNIFIRLLPSLGMLVAAGVMAYFGGMMIVMSAVSGVMAIFTTVMSIREGNKDYKVSTAERIEKYNTYIEKKKQEIQQFRNQEHDELEEIFVSQDVERQYFKTFSPKLFERTPEDEDYLCVRLGSGDVMSKRVVDYKKQEKLEIEDGLQQIPEQLCEEFKNVHDAPVVCDFKEINALGVVGALEYRYEFLKSMVVDIVARQYFSDVKMIFVAEDKQKEQVQCFRFLPYVYNDIIGVRNIVCDDESKNLIFEYLYKELTIREQNKNYGYNIVVFCYDEYGFKSHPISKFVDKAKELGVTFVFFGNETSDIPQGCDYVVSIKDGKNALLVNALNKSETTEFVYSSFDALQMEKIVQLLAPVCTEEISLEGTLTKNISMFELLHILAVDDIDLKSRWETSQVFKSMAAPIGVSKTGIVSLDLHDKAHGPHGLVAGTTGSGKSEILQTYILAMATLYHPYEVGFVIIDFKGGGMVNQFKRLPHLLGAITNIDGKEIERSLKSIKAELQRRQKLFAEIEVNHIDKYIRKYKNGEAEIPLPHLILIVDEFAELKAEQPEFMKELISAARIGRSLGVHLILATQKPSGQVDEQIWSNSRFKLCLKVQNQQDSNEVLKSPLAAEIKEPGRAYLQVGNNEIFELFQSAYSGEAEKLDDSNVKEFTIYRFTKAGRKIPIYIRKKRSGENGSVTQLEGMVEYIANYCDKMGLPKLTDICLPPLRKMIDYENGLVDEYSVPIGIYDNPDNQLQAIYGVNIFADNTFVIGSSMSGKTNLLQLIIRGIAENYSPNEVSVYIIDFSSMVLRNFEKLNHVGGVVVPNEEEKLKNLFRMLKEEIAFRKEKLLSVGVGNFIAYKEAGNKEFSQIVLIIDNLTALKEMYFNEEDFLLPICREGLSVGLSVIIANSQTSGIGYKYFSSINQYVGMYCNDSTEYQAIFNHCRIQPENTPGRCLIQKEKEIYEAQTFISFKGEKEYERIQEISNLIKLINQKHQYKARKIPIIPEMLFESMVTDEFGIKSDLEKLVIGLDFADVTPIALNYLQQDVLAISGSYVEDKYKFINYIKSTLLHLNIEMYILDDYTNAFGDIAESNNVLFYSKNVEDILEMLGNLKSILLERYTEREMNGMSIVDKMLPIVFVINSSDAIDFISENALALEVYKDIIKKYKNLKSFIIFTSVENDSISYDSPEVLKMMRENYQVIIFEDLNNVKLFDSPMSLLKKYKNPIKDGEAYFLAGNMLKKIKTILK